MVVLEVLPGEGPRNLYASIPRLGGRGGGGGVGWFLVWWWGLPGANTCMGVSFRGYLFKQGYLMGM
eukprot:SAG31_NODE_8790_length_1391_cov_2.665890_1_plen_65_part_10